MKSFIPLLFFISFIGVLVASNMYLSRRFSWFFDIKSTWVLYVLFAAITVYMIGGIIAFTNAEGRFANMAYSAAAILLGFMLYLVFSVLLVDLTTFFINFHPKILGTVALLLAFTVSVYGIWNATNKQIREIEIPMKGLNHEIKAMQLSDIHIGHFWGVKTLQHIVNLTNTQKPDVVFITGDLFDGKIRLNKASIAPLKALNAPVYFVEGNHDGYSGAKEVKQKLREIGVSVLENEVTHFSELQLVGLNHMRADNTSSGMHTNHTRATIKNTLGNLHIFPNKPTILLHHSPDGIQYANQAGIDLYLAGHTHAGQLFPVNFIAKWMFSYNKGLHNYKGTKIYVSQGVGTFGPPMRIGTHSELTLLKLKPE